MSKSTNQQLCRPGCINKLERAMANIEPTSFARAIALLHEARLDCVVDLLLAQDGVALLSRERVQVRRMLKKLRCAERCCSGLGTHVDATRSPPRWYCERHELSDDERVSFSQELAAMEEIESAEDRAREE